MRPVSSGQYFIDVFDFIGNLPAPNDEGLDFAEGHLDDRQDQVRQVTCEQPGDHEGNRGRGIAHDVGIIAGAGSMSRRSNRHNRATADESSDLVANAVFYRLAESYEFTEHLKPSIGYVTLRLP